MPFLPWICEFSNCTLFSKPFHIHCNWLIIQSFVNFQIVGFTTNLSPFIAFSSFQMRRCSPILSTFITTNLSSDHFWIFKMRVGCQIFPNSSQSFNHFQIMRCSSIVAINLSSNYLWIFKWGVVRQIFPHSSQLNWANIATILCFRRCTEIGQKLIFFGETLCLRKFSTGKFFRASTHGILMHSENFVHLYGSSPVSTRRWVFKCPASLNEFPHSLQRCGFSPVWMSKCWARFDHWIVE